MGRPRRHSRHSHHHRRYRYRYKEVIRSSLDSLAFSF
jgi:hypothetical protein